MQRVFNISGGRTSGMMVIECYKEGDIVLFCDTGREDPKTYKFLHDFEANENIPIVWLKYEGGFKRLIEKRQMIPNIVMRFCTIELKVKTARRYLRSIGVTKYDNYIGFRYDEQERILKHKEFWKSVKTFFPLNDMRITKAAVIDYWNKKPYDLEVPPILGNCNLCFLKGRAAIINILREYPELANEWIEDEDKIGSTYINGVSYKKMLEISSRPYYKQQNLFDLIPAFNCACTT